jgi:hypothetical protein
MIIKRSPSQEHKAYQKTSENHHVLASFREAAFHILPQKVNLLVLASVLLLDEKNFSLKLLEAGLVFVNPRSGIFDRAFLGLR